MSSEEPGALRERIEAGDPDAQVELGKKLFTMRGPPHAVPNAVRWFAAAAEQDQPEALALLAVATAGGLAIQPDWVRAFDHLQRAAELGWAPAQEQLRFLSGRDGADFAALRACVDIAAWLRPPEAKLEHERPRILTARSVMSAAECVRLIAKTRGRLGRAPVYDAATGGEAVADDRSNTRAELPLLDWDLPHILLQARMSAMLGLPARNFELPNVLHYTPGQEFKLHVDYLDPSLPGLADNVAAFGQRIVTLLVYLSDDYDGGETFFPNLNWGFKGGVGDALMFGNVNERGVPETLSTHAGRPPTRGEKWVLSQWVRDRAPPMTLRVN